MSKYTAIDLFSGAGGLTEGLFQAGFRVLGAVEIDPVAVGTYRENHRAVRLWEGDIREITGETILAELSLMRGELDLLAGCPPCQGFTTLRTRNKGSQVEDARNELVFEMLRLVHELHPKTVMMENVPNLARDARIVRLRGELETLGYQTKVAILDAADFGVPQRRRRMILLGSRVGEIDFASPVTPGSTVRDAFQALPPAGTSGDPLHDLRIQRQPKTLERIRAIPKNGGSRHQLPSHLQLACHRRSDGYRDVYGRMAWDRPAPTITSGCNNPSKGRFLHPEEDRVISLREAAVLQTFRKDYFFPMQYGREAVARMIGNAFPPMFISHQGAMIAKHLKRVYANE